MEKNERKKSPKSLPYEAGKKDIQLKYIVENCIPDTEKINVCDYGCGNGLFLAALSCFPEKSIGIYLPIDEDDEACIETGNHILGNSQIEDKPPNSCKPNNIDFEKYGGKFDIVIMHHIFHEVIQPFELFEQAFKLLKPEGKIVIGDFLFFYWYEPYHVFWDCNTIRELFDSEKFDVNCIPHKDQNKHDSYLAFIALKKGENYPTRLFFIPKLKNIYLKMIKFYRKIIEDKADLHEKVSREVAIYFMLVDHITRRIEEIKSSPLNEELQSLVEIVTPHTYKSIRSDEYGKKRFHLIVPLTWNYIAVHSDTQRDLYSDIVKTMHTATAKFICIYGQPLSGKSTLMRRVGYDLASEFKMV
ncbi:MAG: methyltransferase domain-containing protein, partial [bacterium]